MFLNKGGTTTVPPSLAAATKAAAFLYTETKPGSALRSQSHTHFSVAKEDRKGLSGERTEAANGKPPCAVLKTTLREVLEYCPQSTRVLPAKYAADSCMPRHAEEGDTQKNRAPGRRASPPPSKDSRNAPQREPEAQKIFYARKPRGRHGSQRQRLNAPDGWSPNPGKPPWA